MQIDILKNFFFLSFQLDSKQLNSKLDETNFIIRLYILNFWPP